MLSPGERAIMIRCWRDHGLSAPAGNAAILIEVYVTKNEIYSSGVASEIEDLYERQAREMD